jgi:hypothetical protein
MSPANQASLVAQLQNCIEKPSEEALEVVQVGTIKLLLSAGWSGDLVRLRALLPSVIRSEDTEIVNSAVHALACIACRQGYPSILQYLLDTRKDAVMPGSDRGQLHLRYVALDEPNPDIWAVLLDSDTLSLNGKSSALRGLAHDLVVNRRKNAPEIFKLMVGKGFIPEYDLVHTAAKVGDPETLRYLLSVQLPQVPGGRLGNKYILQHAAGCNRLDNARILIEEGAVDVNEVPSWQEQSDFGSPETPAAALHKALHHLDMIRMLMEHGARATVRDGHWKTPLDRAREAHLYDAEKLMLELTPPKELARASTSIWYAYSVFGILVLLWLSVVLKYV